MKYISSSLFGILALLLVGCDDQADQLTGSESDLNASSGNGAGSDNTANPPAYNHETNSAAANGAPPESTTAGSAGKAPKIIVTPEIASRLHGCGKLSVASLRHLLTSRGLTGGGPRPGGTPSGNDLLSNASAPAALGGANYNGRVPEAPFASTSAMAKMFDIFTMASYDAVSPDWTAPACPSVKILGGDGKFTRDGISCLLGKPATDEHVAIANDAIVKNPTDGAKLAVAAMLSAAHTCQ